MSSNQQKERPSREELQNHLRTLIIQLYAYLCIKKKVIENCKGVKINTPKENEILLCLNIKSQIGEKSIRLIGNYLRKLLESEPSDFIQTLHTFEQENKDEIKHLYSLVDFDGKSEEFSYIKIEYISDSKTFDLKISQITKKEFHGEIQIGFAIEKKSFQASEKIEGDIIAYIFMQFICAGKDRKIIDISGNKIAKYFKTSSKNGKFTLELPIKKSIALSKNIVAEIKNAFLLKSNSIFQTIEKGEMYRILKFTLSL